MRRTSLAVLSAASLLFPLLIQASVADELAKSDVPASHRKVPDQYIVVLKDEVDPSQVAPGLAKKHSGELLHVYGHALKGFAVRLSEKAARTLAEDPRVASVSEDFEVSIARRGDEVSAAAQALPTGVDRINAEAKINRGAGVEVAVIDTGIDLNHPDLKANIIGGKSCIPGRGFGDENGHGSHVAGTIAALDNGTGVVGIAPDAKLWAVRVLDKSGKGTWSGVICGVDFVTSKVSRIKVANMSLGGWGSDGACGSSSLHQAICNSVNAGVTYVVAAGNETDDVKNHVPAAYNEVITVSALADSNGAACGGGPSTSYGADDTFASFSNFGTLASDLAHMLAGPGVAINSTWKGGGYRTISGTSMGTPHVAGAAALYIAANPGATPSQILSALTALAEPGNTDFKGECGGGSSHTATSRHPEPLVRAEGL